MANDLQEVMKLAQLGQDLLNLVQESRLLRKRPGRRRKIGSAKRRKPTVDLSTPATPGQPAPKRPNRKRTAKSARTSTPLAGLSGTE